MNQFKHSSKMAFSEAKMRIYPKYLSALELNYELEIRKLDHPGTAHKCRSLLSQIYPTEVDPSALSTQIPYNEDEVQVLQSIKRMNALIVDKKIPEADMLRAQTIALHLKGRIQRMRHPDGKMSEAMMANAKHVAGVLSHTIAYFTTNRTDLEKTYPGLNDVDDDVLLSDEGDKLNDTHKQKQKSNQEKVHASTSKHDSAKESEEKRRKDKAYKELLDYRKKMFLILAENPDLDFPLESLQFGPKKPVNVGQSSARENSQLNVESEDDELHDNQQQSQIFNSTARQNTQQQNPLNPRAQVFNNVRANFKSKINPNNNRAENENFANKFPTNAANNSNQFTFPNVPSTSNSSRPTATTSNSSNSNQRYTRENRPRDFTPHAEINSSVNVNDLSQLLVSALTQRSGHSIVPINKLGFYFDGTAPGPNSKTVEVHEFLARVDEYKNENRLTDEQMLARIHNLLRGSASIWYRHKKQSISEWEEFLEEFRQRFSDGDDLNTLLSKIYTRKQKQGEITLAYVDEMMEMMDRSKCEFTEEDRLDNILRGIRTEVQRLARTCALQTVDDLTIYIRKVFGRYDAMPAYGKDHRQKFRSPPVNGNFVNRKVSEMYAQYNNNEMLDEHSFDGYEEEYGEYEEEVNAAAKQKTKQRSKGRESKSSDTKSKVSAVQKQTPNQNRRGAQVKTSNVQTDEMEITDDQFDCAEMQPQKTNAAKNGFDSNRYAFADIHCRNCAQNGHVFRQCTNPRVMHCWYCGRLGVTYMNCGCQSSKQAKLSLAKTQAAALAEQEEDSDEETNALIEQLVNLKEVNEVHVDLIHIPENDGRPHIYVKVLDAKYVYVVLDTGSQVTMIGKNHYDAWCREIKGFKELPMRQTRTCIVTANRSRHKPLGEMDITYTVQDKTKTVRTIIADLDMPKPLFGVDFQKAIGMALVMVEAMEMHGPSKKKVTVNEKHELSPEQEKVLKETIALFPFTDLNGPLNVSPHIEHIIDTGDHAPLYQKPYNIAPEKVKRAKIEIERLVQRQIIEPIQNSPWNLPVICVDKPENRVRICIDARKLNKITVLNRYFQTNLNRVLARVKRAKYISVCDVSDAFHQCNLEKESRAKCSFILPGIGRYCYLRMPCGLVNSCSTLCQLVDTMFNEIDSPEIIAYLDDFVCLSETFDSHIESLKFMANQFREAGLTISEKKSEFGLKRARWLGQVISEKGIEIDPTRIDTIVNYKRPSTNTAIKSFLGLCGWYRRYIDDFSTLASPLSDCLKGLAGKNMIIKWNEKAENAFTALKNALISAPVLQPPSFNKLFIIEASSNGIAVAGILSQEVDERINVIAYTSAKLTEAQRKFSRVELECLAVIHCVEKWKIYVTDRKIQVRTNHQNLIWLQNCQDSTGRLGRWGLRLQAYHIEFVQRKTKRKLINTEVLCEAITEDTPDLVLEEGEFLIDLVPDDETAEQEKSPYVDSIAKNGQPSGVQEILLVNVDDFKGTGDDWYLQKFDLAHDLPNYKVENDILYYRYDYKHKPFEIEWKIVVPKEFVYDVFVQEHENTISSHGGFYKTYFRIRDKYFFPNMYNTTYNFVKNCTICRTTKASTENTKAPMYENRIPTENFQTLYLDFIGRLPMSKERNQWLLVAVDGLSKYVFTKPMNEAKTRPLIKFLVNEIFLKYSVPETIITDNGGAFRSKEFSQLCIKLNIKLVHTAAYSAWPNASEAVNKVIGNAIRAYLVKMPDQTYWCRGMSEITHALNTARHSQAELTPHMVVFGRNIVRDGREYQLLHENQPLSQVTHEKRELINQHVRQCLKDSYETAKKKVQPTSKGTNVSNW